MNDSREVRTLDGLVESGMLTRKQATELGDLVDRNANVVIAGNTATGKTTLLEAMAARIDPDQRIILAFEAVPDELQFSVEQIVARPANPDATEAHDEDGGVVGAVAAAMRLRPDRIIVGEVRSESAAADTLDAMRRIPGVLATIHAATAEDAATRLTRMSTAVMGDVPVASVVDAIVVTERTSEGTCRVTGIYEFARDIKSSCRCGCGNRLVSTSTQYAPGCAKQ